MPIPDNSTVVENQIKPLVEQIYEICKDNGIPVVMAFEYAAGKTVTTVRANEDTCRAILLAATVVHGS